MIVQNLNMKNKGFTLLEVILYVAVVSIVALAVTSIASSVNSGQGRTMAESAVNSTLRFVTNRVDQDIRSASSVTTPSSAGSSSATLVLVVGTDTVTYSISNNQLVRQLNSEQQVALTGNNIKVTSINFTLNKNTNTFLSSGVSTITSVTMSVSAAYNSNSSDLQYSSTKTITEILQ